jgi:subtilisin family serine protease
VKADAAARVFEISCRDLAWAVIDSGIDARHVAFRARDAEGRRHPVPFKGEQNFTRVASTYDFTVVRELLSEDTVKDVPRKRGAVWTDEDRQKLCESLADGREVDWEFLKRFLEVRHTAEAYEPPRQEHGTHVAGILGGDCRERSADVTTEAAPAGLCPDLQLYDLRVLDENGEGDEFNVMAALQFVRYLNAHQQATVIHGVNLSLSIRHDIANFACGRTPVCEECERLLGAGIIVVAAAGNDGYLQYLTPRGPQDSYRSISITDPGNAAGVITVGSTHRFQPHTYGVSYFSSRGPTGDGRAKPDLVAPGEKIEAPVGGEADLKRMDGTSMAAPHASGAAALLIARHRELAGQPARVKQILCATATDLGRERYFQGAGMLDVLRALQSV